MTRRTERLTRAIALLAWCCDEAQVLGRDRMLVRFAGHEMHTLGGLRLMQAAYYEVVLGRRTVGTAGFHPMEVDLAWNGIGDWIS